MKISNTLRTILSIVELEKLRAIKVLESEINNIESSEVGHPLVRLYQMICTWEGEPREVVRAFLDKYGSILE